MKPVTTEVDQCVTAAGYLDNRAIPAAGSTSRECVKTGDYLDRRTVPALPNPVENVDTITFDYTYDGMAAGAEVGCSAVVGLTW